MRSKRDGQSIGAIVSDLVWEAHEKNIDAVELIPAFDKEELYPIRGSVRATGSIKCCAYDKLRPVQQKWLNVTRIVPGYTIYNGILRLDKPHFVANPAIFEKTTCKTIALEMRKYHSASLENKIDSTSMEQFIRVLNYAHDQGGRRVILINQTGYNSEKLLLQIKTQLPECERERSWSRLMLLLCETEDFIFEHEQFNGHIDGAILKRSLPDDSDRGQQPLRQNQSRFFKEIISRMGCVDAEYFIEDSYESELERGLTLVAK